MPRPFQFSFARLLLVLIGSVAAGSTAQYIASSTIWTDGKHSMRLSPQGSILFFLLGVAAGCVAALVVLPAKPPEWANKSRLGPPFIKACTLFVSCLAGAFAFVGWRFASAVLPHGFYRFVLQDLPY